WNLQLLVLERRGDRVDGQSTRAQRVLVDGDVDLVLDPRTNGRGANARQRVELLLERILGQILQLGQSRTREHDGGDALGVEINFCDGRRIGVSWQGRADPVDDALNVNRYQVRIRRARELDADNRHPRSGGRCQPVGVDIGQRGDGVLDGTRHI